MEETYNGGEQKERGWRLVLEVEPCIQWSFELFDIGDKSRVLICGQFLQCFADGTSYLIYNLDL